MTMVKLLITGSFNIFFGIPSFFALLCHAEIKMSVVESMLMVENIVMMDVFFIS